MLNVKHLSFAGALLALSCVSACGAKSTNTSVESSDARSAELRDSFQCAGVESSHLFDRSATTLVYSFYATGMTDTRSLNIYGDGKVLAHRAILGGETKDSTQTLSAEDLDSVIFALVDKFCLLSVTEESVKNKIKTINSSYEAAHPGKVSYGKPRMADCGAPKVTVSLDGKDYSSAFDTCNAFNTYLDNGSPVAEEKFVIDAHTAAFQYLDSVLTSP